MKTKLLTIFGFVLCATLFSACAEEEILPQENILQTEGSNGEADDDPCQWGCTPPPPPGN